MAYDPAAPKIVTPLPGEIAEAKRTPGGWVYRIAGKFGPKDPITLKTLGERKTPGGRCFGIC
jgi:hypothetical protein